MPTIAIIGAGLMGRLLALSLNRQGYKITLFDKDQKNGQQSAAYAAAGLLTPLGEAMHSPANIVAMGFAALPLWPKLLTTLNSYNFFQQSGSLVVSHEQDKADGQRLSSFLANNYPEHEQQQLNRQQLSAGRVRNTAGVGEYCGCLGCREYDQCRCRNGIWRVQKPGK